MIASLVAAAATISAVFLVLQSQSLLQIFATNSSDAGKLTIISISDSSLTNQSGYVISPDPFGNFVNYTVYDGSSADENNAAGIVEISGLPEGRYLVTQTEPSSQHATNKLSKTVEIMNQNRNGVAMFNNIAGQGSEQQEQQQKQQEVQNRTSPIRNLTYYVKFECGTISGDEGPLRPGHYD
ncbi:MAG: hypothetical protein M3382_05410, partial [Thermoproteota archaeon]|nr:hypothetical protein [Thermoproteota archaeon]